ncbi:hypothetical protein DASC09_052610 [Saccharomycopsis crataegensis]|uniref:Uncharacterized protein n=1 Tax=Saccharomycopsis crataegensis TaxID=43959 RepID=A0AAV5QTR5_9ASCO|nr:hypothetical protein DASC09_052610 [Saccharomycopsis crataegensis]
MTNPPKEETPTYRSIGRGGGGNMFKTDPADHSPKLIPVSSAGHALPPDQKKFSISRGGYGNIRDNKPSEVDELGSGSRHGSFHYEEMPVLNSVKSIGRGGFGNQIRNIKSHDSAQKNLEGEESKSFFEKVMKFFK